MLNTPAMSPDSSSITSEAGEVVARAAAEELVELVGALGRVRPGPVQLAALVDHLEEGVAV